MDAIEAAAPGRPHETRGTADEVPSPREPRSTALVVAAWTAGFVTLGAVQYLVRAWDPTKSPRLLDGWVQFDGPEYLAIATEGYQRRQLVWFPAYPTMLGLLDGLLGAPVLAGVIVSAVAGVTAVVLFWRWTARRGMPIAARWTALAVLMLYPYGWFLYGVVYSDALFLALVLGAFVLLERGDLRWAVLVGACATATRPSGFAVVLGLAVLSAERSGLLRVPESGPEWVRALRLPVELDRTRLGPSALLPLASAGGLVAYMGYLWWRWGNPLAFVTEQSNYHHSGPGTLLKWQYFEQWYGGVDARHLATTTAQAVLLVLVLVSVPAVGRRFGWGYGVFVLALAALPMASVSTFMGVGRYLLPAFPVFALVGEWLAHRPRWRVAVLVPAACILVVLAAGFARSWYLT